jgi:hypothetical protein
VIFKWGWSGILAEDEWFAVRVGRKEVDSKPVSKVWIKGNEYLYSLSEPGDYSWEVAVCRGEPESEKCEQLVVSGRNEFWFGGCSTPNPAPDPSPIRP